MAQRDYSNYQKKVISRYYDNREAIDTTRLAEMVTNLYLATGEKQIEKLWKSAEEMMTRLEVPASRVTHVITRRDPAVLAEVVQDLNTGKIGPGK